MTQEEFIQKIRTKYPNYNDMDDQTLLRSVINKYPIYRDSVEGFAPADPYREELKDPSLKPLDTIDFNQYNYEAQAESVNTMVDEILTPKNEHFAPEMFKSNKRTRVNLKGDMEEMGVVRVDQAGNKTIVNDKKILDTLLTPDFISPDLDQDGDTFKEIAETLTYKQNLINDGFKLYNISNGEFDPSTPDYTKDSIGDVWTVGLKNLITATAEGVNILPDLLYNYTRLQLLGPMGALSKASSDILNYVDPETIHQDLFDYMYKDKLGVQDVLEDQAKAVEENIKEFSESIEADMPTGKYARDPESVFGYLDPNRFYMTLGHNALLTGTMIGATLANPYAGTAMMLALEGGSTKTAILEYEEKTGKKIPAHLRDNMPIAVGVLNASLERLGIDQITKGVPGVKTKILKVLVGSFIEGGTEGLQEVNQMIAKSVAIDEELFTEENWRQLKESFYAGWVLGTFGTTVTGGTGLVEKINQDKFNQTTIGKQILEAREKDTHTKQTLDMAESIAKKNPEAFEGKSVVNFSDEVRVITAEELKGRGWSDEKIKNFWLGEGVDPNTVIGMVTGSTLVEENGNILINLYKGATPGTVVEEFYGNHFRRLSPEDRKIFKDHYQEFLDEGGRLTEQEFFEKEGKKYFFQNNLDTTNPIAKIYKRIKNFFNDFLGNSTLSPEIRSMYEKAGEAKIDKAKAEGDVESFEITRVDQVADKVKGRKVRKGSEVKVALKQGLENVLTVLEDENFDMEGSFEWYRSKITNTVDIASEEIPGLKEDRVKQGIFKALLGITSHGTKVPPNYDYTVAGMKHYLENGEFNMGKNATGKDVFISKNDKDKDVIVGTTKSPVVGQNVLKLKNLIDKFGEQGAVEWILTKHKGRDIESETGVKKYAHLKKDNEYYGAMAFGPKIGRYIVNLNGIHEEAVYDVWWSRAWNRWMGTPFKVNKEGKFFKDDKGRKIMQETPRGNPERELMDQVVEGLKTELSEMTGYQWDADQVQAVLWYYEKELYIREGSQQEKGTNYAEQAVRRAKEKGYYEQFTTSKDNRESTETQERRSSIQGKPSKNIESSQEQIVRTGKTVGQKDSEVTSSGSPVLEGESFEITPTQKEYFKDTKVTDTDGNPKVVYHGTTVNFDKFDPEKGQVEADLGAGIYFTDNTDDLSINYARKGPDLTNKIERDTERLASERDIEYDTPEYKKLKDDVRKKYMEHRGASIPVYVDLKNPAIVDRNGGTWIESMEEYNEEYDDFELNEDSPAYKMWDAVPLISQKYDTYDWAEVQKAVGEALMEETTAYNFIESLKQSDAFLDNVTDDEGNLAGNDFIKELFKAGGFDGFIVNDVNERWTNMNIPEGTNHYIAFDPKQVKSVFNENPADTGESFEIISDKEPLNIDSESRADQLKDWLNIKFVDELGRLNQIQEKIGDIPEEQDAYMFFQNMIGRASSRRDAMQDDLYKSKNSLVKRMNKDGFGIDDLGEFLYAKHSAERDKAMQEKGSKKGSGMDSKTRNAILKKYRGTNMNKYAKEFYNKVTKKALDIRLESGLITQEAYNTLSKFYKNYVPLKGTIEDENFTYTPGSGFSVTTTGVQGAEGRESIAQNPAVQAIIDLESAIVLSEKNRAMQSLYSLLKSNPHSGWSISGRRSYPIKGALNEDGEPFLKKKDLANNEVSVFIEGKQKVITIKDEKLLRGIRKLGSTGTNRYVQMYMTYFRAINTSFNPEFIITNFERDLQTALVHLGSEHGAKVSKKVIKDTRRAMKGIYKNLKGGKGDWADIYQEYKDGGGKVGWMDFKTLEEKTSEIQTSIRRYNQASKPYEMFLNLAQDISDINEVVENGIRLSTYKNLVDSGISKDKAIQFSKDLTVNFNRKGELGSVFNSFWAFSNAGIQGTNRIFRALTHKDAKVRRSAQKIVSGITIAGFTTSWINRMINEDDWEDYSDYNKAHHFMILLPDGNTFAIKLPYGYNFFYSLGSTLEEVINGDTRKAEGLFKLLTNASSAFSPLTLSSDLANFAPTIGQPLAQILSNTNFMGGKIADIKEFGSRKPRSQEYFDSARPFPKWLTKWLNKLGGGSSQKSGGVLDWNPEYLDHIWDSYTGGVGRFFGNTLSTAGEMLKGEIPAIENIPFTRQFIKAPSEYQPKKIVYGMIDESARVKFSKDQRDRFKRNLNKMYSNKDIDRAKRDEMWEDFKKNQRRVK